MDGRPAPPFDVRNTYDDLNRLVAVEDAHGHITRYEYDGEGNRTAQLEPEGQRTEFDYGELNELIEVPMADGASSVLYAAVWVEDFRKPLPGLTCGKGPGDE